MLKLMLILFIVTLYLLSSLLLYDLFNIYYSFYSFVIIHTLTHVGDHPHSPNTHNIHTRDKKIGEGQHVKETGCKTRGGEDVWET